jgi:hypothetical protein
MAFLLFFTAVLLSGIAAYYSVIGLTAVFAAAAIPVAIMGASLELAKLVVASWLYRFWDNIPVLMRSYFTAALVILMAITSMGVFGYLSKAHLDQGVPTGEVAAKVALLDEKIKTQRDNVEAARSALKQLDSQVDQLLGRTTDDRGAERAVQIRRQQAAERTKLQREIATAQTEIAKLNQERAPIASELRKVEAEVGPIKYIAALIYGDNPDESTLERAVRWLIIMLIIVFDPLAVLMLIAANLTMIKQRELAANTVAVNQPEEKDLTLEKKETIITDEQQTPTVEVKQEASDNFKVLPDESTMPVAAEVTIDPVESEVKVEVAVQEPVELPKKPTATKKKVKKTKKVEELQPPVEPKLETAFIAVQAKADDAVEQPSVEQQVAQMIDNNDQEGLEQVYKQIVKELAKKNRSKTTHWGPIRNTKK